MHERCVVWRTLSLNIRGTPATVAVYAHETLENDVIVGEYTPGAGESPTYTMTGQITGWADDKQAWHIKGVGPNGSQIEIYAVHSRVGAA